MTAPPDKHPLLVARDGAREAQRPHDAPEWLWYGEVDGKPVVTFGRWPKHGAKWRYKWADIQPTEHDRAALQRPDAAGDGERVVWEIDHDGFKGVEIGSYTTLEGKQGVVLQQIGTKVVHVYGRKWLKPALTNP